MSRENHQIGRLAWSKGLSRPENSVWPFQKVRISCKAPQNARLTSAPIREIEKVQEGLETLGRPSSGERALLASEISGMLQGYVQTITWHVGDLHVCKY